MVSYSSKLISLNKLKLKNSDIDILIESHNFLITIKPKVIVFLFLKSYKVDGVTPLLIAHSDKVVFSFLQISFILVNNSELKASMFLFSIYL